MTVYADMERLRRCQHGYSRAMIFCACAASLCALFQAMCFVPDAGQNGIFNDVHAPLVMTNDFRPLGITFVEKVRGTSLARVFAGSSTLFLPLSIWLLSRGMSRFAGLSLALLLISLVAGYLNRQTIFYSVHYAGAPVDMVAAADAYAGPTEHPIVTVRATVRYVAAQQAYLADKPADVGRWLSEAVAGGIEPSDATPGRVMAMHEYATAHGYRFSGGSDLQARWAWHRPSLLRAASWIGFCSAIGFIGLAGLCAYASLTIGNRLKRIAVCLQLPSQALGAKT